MNKEQIKANIILLKEKIQELEYIVNQPDEPQLNDEDKKFLIDCKDAFNRCGSTYDAFVEARNAFINHMFYKEFQLVSTATSVTVVKLEKLIKYRWGEMLESETSLNNFEYTIINDIKEWVKKGVLKY